MITSFKEFGRRVLRVNEEFIGEHDTMSQPTNGTKPVPKSAYEETQELSLQLLDLLKQLKTEKGLSTEQATLYSDLEKTIKGVSSPRVSESKRYRKN